MRDLKENIKNVTVTSQFFLKVLVLDVKIYRALIFFFFYNHNIP